MTQLNRIQLITQTSSHVKMTKILSTASVKIELLTASACLEYASSETNKTHDFVHVYKLITYLVSLAKSLLLHYNTPSYSI